MAVWEMVPSAVGTGAGWILVPASLLAALVLSSSRVASSPESVGQTLTSLSAQTLKHLHDI